MTHPRHWLRTLIRAPHAPVAVYLMVVGILALTSDPTASTVGRVLPDWLTWAWAGALTIGGPLILTGVATERTRGESAGHVCHLFGISLYAAVAVVETGIGLMDVFVVAVLAAVSVSRLLVLHDARKAYEEARRIHREQP